MSKDRFFSGGGQSEIDALNSDIHTVVNTPTGITGVVCEKVGRIVMCEIDIPTQRSSPSKGWLTIGTLPSIYRPLIRVREVGFDNNATTLDKMPCIFQILRDGNIQWYATGAVSGILPAGTFTYVSAS